MNRSETNRLIDALRDKGILGGDVDDLDDDKTRLILDSADTRALTELLKTTPNPPSSHINYKKLSEVADKVRRVTQEPMLRLPEVLTETELEVLNEYLHDLAFDLDGEGGEE